MGGKNDIVLPTYQLNIPKKNIRTNKSLEHMKYPLHQSDAICGPQLVEARVPTFLYQGT
jgi:hypothetical protein